MGSYKTRILIKVNAGLLRVNSNSKRSIIKKAMFILIHEKNPDSSSLKVSGIKNSNAGLGLPHLTHAKSFFFFQSKRSII